METFINQPNTDVSVPPSDSSAEIADTKKDGKCETHPLEKTYEHACTLSRNMMRNDMSTEVVHYK